MNSTPQADPGATQAGPGASEADPGAHQADPGPEAHPAPAEPDRSSAKAIPDLRPGLALQARLMVAAVAVFALGVVLWPHEIRSSSQGGFLLDGDGRAATLGARLAPVTLLHFWATWCPPCIAEAPALARLAQDFSGHHDFGIVMVAVADSRDRVTSFLGTGAEMVLYDPRWDVAHRYGTEKLPETYLVVNGKVVEKFVGETDWDAPAVRAKLSSHLEGAPPEQRSALPAGPGDLRPGAAGS